MTRYMFPLMVITLTVALFGPMATGWIAGLTLDMANDTAAALSQVKP